MVRNRVVGGDRRPLIWISQGSPGSVAKFSCCSSQRSTRCSASTPDKPAGWRTDPLRSDPLGIDADTPKRHNGRAQVPAPSVLLVSTHDSGWTRRLAKATARSRWAVATVALTSAVAVLLVINISLVVAVLDKHLQTQWGTPFDAFTAVGTVGALVWALVNGLQLRRQAEQDRREMAEERTRSHASQISAWTERSGVRKPTPYSFGE